MKTHKLLLLSTLFVGLLISFVNAQTGISYFINTDTQMPNAKVIDIIESNDGNIVLLNLCSDSKYINHTVQYINVTPEGNVQIQKTLDKENLYGLSAIEKKSNNEYAVFGNTSLNKSFAPFQLNISNDGQITSNIQHPQVYSTLISDVIGDQENFMMLYSKVGKNDLYNISLHKINTEKGNVEWLKKISSENNEEADKIVTTNSGEFYVLGKKYNDDVTEFVPIIYKIDNAGQTLWKKGIDVPSNFNKQSIHILNNDEIIYVCGYTKNPTGFSETRVIKLSNSGEETGSSSIKDFSANGIIKITDETYLIYGSKFIVNRQQVITKGKFVIVNKQLNELVEKTLDENDKPDIQYRNKAKTSSDFLCAQKLSNNKIAIGGKVFMPITADPENRYNVPLLIVINNDGTYQK